MTTINTSFTAVGVSATLLVRRGDAFTYAITGTFVGQWILEKSVDDVSWYAVASGTVAGSGTVRADDAAAKATRYRMRCAAYTSGTIVSVLADAAVMVQEFKDAAGNVVMRLTEAGVEIIRKITYYNGVATDGGGVPAIRAENHLEGQTAAIPSICTYTPAVDASVEVVCGLLVAISSAESFTVTAAYTDIGNTPRVATLPLRTLAGANVLSVTFAQGAVPYMGVLTRFRAKGGTAVTIATTGSFSGCTYSVGANIREAAQ